MSEVLLIHGAGHGAWAWDLVLPELAASGVTARALDLPGRGVACTLADQVAAVVAEMRGPTVLVPHSAGGFVATAAAMDARVRGVIYVCAYVPEVGKSLAQMRRAWPDRPLDGHFTLDHTRGVFGFTLARELFFHDCADMSARLCDEALAPAETALHVLPDVARGYIRCLDDRAIPLEFQEHMARGIGLQAALPCGHSPFLAQPVELARKIAAMVLEIEQARVSHPLSQWSLEPMAKPPANPVEYLGQDEAEF
jgi:pimeloyl-ACP methyl ester carboxylesterase